MQKTLKNIRKVLDKVIKLERILCCCLLVAILAVCFTAVVMRYCFNSPLSWSEEVIIVLLVWFGYLCMSVETYNDTNIAITGFYAMLPKGVQKAYTLDGGQTAEIVMFGAPINHVDFGFERTVSDIIYFATAIPEEEVR